jgi:hypothetical protein
MRSQHTRNGRRHNGKAVNGRGQKAALALLLEAFDGAQREGRPARQDAVTWNVLHDLGLSRADLEDLLAGGHIEHLEETTRRKDKKRTFRKAAGGEPGPLSRLVLTARGAPGARQLLAVAETEPGAVLHEALARAEERPYWNGEEGTLWWGGEVVKVLRHDAVNQRCVLDALQGQGWPRHLADPLPKRSRRSPKKCLRQTIDGLNRRQEGPVRVCFHADRRGGLRWEGIHMKKRK